MDQGYVRFSAPGLPLYQQTGFPGRDFENLRGRRIGIDRRDAIFRLRPGNVTQQPGPWRIGGKVRRLRRRNRLQADDPVLEGEGPSIGKMQTAQDNDGALPGQCFFLGTFCFSNLPRKQSQAIAAAARDDIRLDVRNIQYQ